MVGGIWLYWQSLPAYECLVLTLIQPAFYGQYQIQLPSCCLVHITALVGSPPTWAAFRSPLHPHNSPPIPHAWGNLKLPANCQTNVLLVFVSEDELAQMPMWKSYCEYYSASNISLLYNSALPLVLWRFWLCGRKGIRPVKNWVVGCWHGYLSGARRGVDLHMAQLMPLPLTISCFSKIQIDFTFLVPAHPGSPGKRAIKRVCVCVYI